MGTQHAAQFLSRIVHAKRLELAAAKLRVPRKELEKQIRPRSPGAFRSALLTTTGQSDCAIIAELKKASPSRGMLREEYDPVAITQGYKAAGARALSVLTDCQFFQGSLDDLRQAKAATSLPVLRKDFTLAEYHIYEAAAAGADAVLLIVAILEPLELAAMIKAAHGLGLDALVEVHTADELRVAVDAGSDIIGVNNRDLRTFQVSLDVSLKLADAIPDHAVAISESGIRTADDIERLRSAGFDAFLIGERFMAEADPGEALGRLLADVSSREFVKRG
jgi:indole-3-glycerol phosphate synthase